jgi:hypothetical protein
MVIGTALTILLLSSRAWLQLYLGLGCVEAVRIKPRQHSQAIQFEIDISSVLSR